MNVSICENNVHIKAGDINKASQTLDKNTIKYIKNILWQSPPIVLMGNSEYIFKNGRVTRVRHNEICKRSLVKSFDCQSAIFYKCWIKSADMKYIQ